MAAASSTERRALLVLWFCVCATQTSTARAAPATAAESNPGGRPKSYGLEAAARVGYGSAELMYPAYDGGFAGGVYLQLDIGYRISARWLLSAQISQVEVPVEESADLRFRALHVGGTAQRTSYVTIPGDTLPGDGSLHTHSIRAGLIGLRGEYSPRMLPGAYLALVLGMTTLTLDYTFLRSGVGTSLGYRYAFAPSAAWGFCLGLDGSVGSSERGPAAASWVAYAATELRLF